MGKNGKSFFTRPSFITFASFFVLFVIIGTTILISWVLYNRTVTILTDNLRQRLLTISITEAANIDANDLNALQIESDWKKPEWGHVVNSLHRAKYSNTDIVFMYIFRYTKDPTDDPKNMEFVGDADSIDPYANINNVASGTTVSAADCPKCVDSNRDGKIEPDGPDKLQWPGQPFPEANSIPEAYEAYMGPITVKDIYTDEYGSVLTGFAPIKDASGTVVAILGTDIKANDFFIITAQTLQPFLIFISLLSLIISILILILIYSWKKNSKFLEETNKKLESLDKLKNEFLSLATHQLQSPLSSIIGYTSTIIDGLHGAISDQQKDILQRILQSGKNLSHVIDDFLNVSKIESGGMKYEKVNFNFAEIAESTAKELSITANKKGLELIYSDDKNSPYNVNGDKEKLRQVVLNLIDNAIKYTKTGTIKVMMMKHDKNVIFAVQDNGMGISPQTMSTLFQKFSRGDESKMNTKGSGLGLFLVKEIVNAHGGNVWAESQGTGKGSTFYVQLPLN